MAAATLVEDTAAFTAVALVSTAAGTILGDPIAALTAVDHKLCTEAAGLG
jgi:hypothetical protein